MSFSVRAETFNILIIHSYQQEFPQTKTQHSGFVDGISEGLHGQPLNIFTEYLNGKTSITALEDPDMLDRYMQSKYLLNKPDLIYATNDEAIAYLTQTKLSYLKDVPLVFTGVTEMPDLERRNLTAGIIERHNIKYMTDLINKIFNAKPDIVFLDSGSVSSWALKLQIDDYLKEKNNNQKIEYVIDSDIDKLLKNIKHCAGTVFIIVNAGGFRSEGRHSSLEESLNKLHNGLPSKYVMNLHELEIQSGIMGGVVTSGYDQGHKSGLTAAQMLMGQTPEKLITESVNHLVFDRQAIDASGVELPADIEEKTRFINNYPSFIDRHGHTLLTMVILLTVLMLITSVTFSVYTYSQQQKLKETSAKFAEASRKNKQYMDAVDASNLVSIADANGRIKYINDQYLMVSGYSREELMGKSHRVLNHPAMESKLYSALVKTVTKGRIWYGVLLNKTKNGETLYLETSIVPINDTGGNIVEYLSIRKDITQVIRQQKEIKSQYTDILTGLPNRVRMRLDKNSAKMPAVAILNIDSFSVINTYYGLEAGDHILKEFADKLRKMVGSGMKVYRVSGDEFGVLAKDVPDYDSFNASIISIMENISAMPFEFEGNDLHLSVTAGTANGYETIITKAGMALRHAKKHKKNLMTYKEVESEMEKLRETVHYSSSLRDALAAGKVIPYFQPVADTIDGRIVKYEALMRVEAQDGTLLMPDNFLYLSKQLKLYDALSMMMMEKTLEFIKDSSQSICINFDIEDILNDRFQSRFFELVAAYGLQGRVTIEITESEGIDNLDELSAFVTKAKSAGCMIAIDDFGTGYSNFMYILSLQPDYLKIDGSITRQITVSKRARLLTSTITAMCREAGIKTVAEYVATEDIYNCIREVGIDYCQGYLFGKPEPFFKNRI